MAVQGGTQEVDPRPSELRFNDKHKGIDVSVLVVSSAVASLHAPFSNSRTVLDFKLSDLAS